MKEWADMDLAEVAAYSGEPGSLNSVRAPIEMLRRQTLAQIEAADAQKAASAAAVATAEYTRRNARYMLWSVMAILATALFPYVVKLLGLTSG